MSLTLAFACSPRRHNQAAGSESIIERERGPLPGTAVFFRTHEGTFLVLEEYDEELAGHCLVFGWFGSAPESGSYEVRQLAYGTVEAEVDEERHSFYGVGIVRVDDEDSVFVTESGRLELESVAPGRITGSFELSGFLVEGGARTDRVDWSGSFDAVEGEG